MVLYFTCCKLLSCPSCFIKLVRPLLDPHSFVDRVELGNPMYFYYKNKKQKNLNKKGKKNIGSIIKLNTHDMEPI